MNRGFRYSPKRKTSPPRRGSSELQGSVRTRSNRSRQANKQDLNIDDFGDMGSDEDDFQNLAVNFVPKKLPAHPQYNLVPHGFLRDDDELANEDYDGVPIDSASSSPKPESPVRPWKRSPLKEEMKGDPITVIGSGNRPDPMASRWPHDVKSQDKPHSNRFLSGSSSSGAHSSFKMETSSGTQYPLGKGRWDSKIGQIGASNSGKNIPPFMGINSNVGKGPAFVRAQDESNPFMDKPPPPENTRNFVHAKEERNPFLQTSLGQTSSDSSKNFVSTKSVAFPVKNIGYPPPSDKPSSSWNDQSTTVKSNLPAWGGLRRESPGVKEEVLPTSNPAIPQIGVIQAAALQQALAGITHLDPQAGLNLLMQASQNPTLAAALAGNITKIDTGVSGSQLPFNNPAVGALLKSAAPPAVPMVPDRVIQTNLSVPPPGYTGSSRTAPCKLPDGSGATRYPAPDLTALVFDPSTGYRFDGSTGLHYDANSGYFFNNKLKIFLRWDKFTQTYLRVENPPGVPRAHLSTDPPAYQKGSAQEKVEIFASAQNAPFSNEIHQSSKSFPTSSQEVGTLRNLPKSHFLEQRNSAQSNNPPNSYSGGSECSLVDSKYQPLEAKPSTKSTTLPNFAETNLFNKLRKAKLAAHTKSDRKQWGEPDPLLETVQKLDKNSQPQKDVLNLEEILQRSRQFMKGSAGDPVNVNDGNKERVKPNRSPDRSGDGRRVRSRSRSPVRPRRSQSLERVGIRRGTSTVLPQSGRAAARESPGSRRLDQRHSKGRSPVNRARDRRSPSPQLKRRPAYRGTSPPKTRGRRSMSPEVRKHRSTSRGRSPHNRPRRRPSPSPEFRKKKSTSRCRTPKNWSRGRRSLSPEEKKRGRSPIRNRGKYSKSPEPKYRRTSRGRSSDQKLPARLSNSPDRRRQHSQIPDRNSLNRSASPVVKVVLNQSSGGSKVRVADEKRAANLLSSDRRAVQRKSSATGVSSERNLSPGRRDLEDEGDGRVEPKPCLRRLGMKDSHDRESKREDQGSGIKVSKSNKNTNVSGYKSLSNLRNQAREKPRETHQRRDTRSGKFQDKTTDRKPPKAVDAAEDDERGSRENHRLVNERTFSASWKMKKPEPSQLPSTENAENSIGAASKEKEGNPGVSDELEESNEFDFLNDTLDDGDNGDDDGESTVIDEYEEILDYQDLESNSESKVSVPNAPENDVKPLDIESKELSKESTESSVIAICVDPSEKSIEASTSVDSASESLQLSRVDGTELVEVPSANSVDQIPQNGVQNSDALKNKQMGGEDRSVHALEEVSEARDNLGDGVQNSDALKNKQMGGEDRSVHTREEVSGARDNFGDGAKPNDGVNLTDEPIIQSGTKSQSSKPLFPNDESSGTKDTDVTNKKREEEIKETVKELSDNRGYKSPRVNEMIGHEEWNVLDSVDDHEVELPASEAVSSKNNLSKVTESLSSKMQDDQPVANLKEAKESPATHSDAVPQTAKFVDQGDLKDTGLLTDDGNNQPKVEPNDGPSVLGSGDIKEDKENTQIEKEESLVQVRSVSDIEKFLLLSSQEVEAKREQGVESDISKTEKKRGVFSRLGEKLSQDEESTESTSVPEKPAEIKVVPQKPSNPSAQLVLDKEPKPAAKKPKLEDPCKALFVDDPTPIVLVGPMNFIEPLGNFQHFTQKYMQTALTEEDVPFKTVYVCHEDSTGAPYHYILITFTYPHAASDWIKKHKGVYKGDPKIFKMISGYTRHKLVPDAVAFLHFTEPNWWCRVCKRSNFPPRSLCFGCFQNKDPDGFSPLVIVEKTWKQTSWVGTPKLKFFATKEKVLESTPPLDGFDIQRIEMIMDEEMGLPAGICVFELPTYIEAGKLKKFFNNREIEAVSVKMHERFLESVSDPSVSKETPLKVREKADLPASRSCSPRTLPKESEGRRRRDVLESGARSPRFSSREVRVTMPSTSQDRPSRSMSIQSGSAVSLCEEGRYPSPARSVRAVVSRTVKATSPSLDIEPTYESAETVYHSKYKSPPRYRSRSPVRDPDRRRSHLPRSRSPLPRSRSPVPRIRSPVPRSCSPIPRNRSPVPRSRSPVLRRRSPPLRRRTPSLPSPPPKLRSLFDVRLTIPERHEPRRRSPLPRSRSPLPRSRSPLPRSRSPLPRSRSPIPRSRSPVPRRRSPPLRRRTPLLPSPPPKLRSLFEVRPIKPDGRSDWSYPPPDPKNFKFEPRSGLDYDPTTTLYYEPKSCCFYNDDSNEWLEYEPKTGCYRVVS